MEFKKDKIDMTSERKFNIEGLLFYRGNNEKDIRGCGNGKRKKHIH